MPDTGQALSAADYGRHLEDILEHAAGYALSIIRHRSDAEDAVQQAALRGLKRLHQYDRARPFRGWWFTVLRHCCLDSLRARQRRHRRHRRQELEAAIAQDAQLRQRVQRLAQQDRRWREAGRQAGFPLRLALPHGVVADDPQVPAAASRSGLALLVLLLLLLLLAVRVATKVVTLELLTSLGLHALALGVIVMLVMHGIDRRSDRSRAAGH